MHVHLGDGLIEFDDFVAFFLWAPAVHVARVNHIVDKKPLILLKAPPPQKLAVIVPSNIVATARGALQSDALGAFSNC